MAPVQTAAHCVAVDNHVVGIDVHRNIHPDDLTSFLAGECTPDDGAAIGRAIASDPVLRIELIELAAAVSMLRDAAGFLAFAGDGDGSEHTHGLADEATA